MRSVDASDIDLLTAAIRNQTPGYDLNGDGQLNDLDLDVMVVDILETSYGDADLDQVIQLQRLRAGLPVRGV